MFYFFHKRHLNNVEKIVIPDSISKLYHNMHYLTWCLLYFGDKSILIGTYYRVQSTSFSNIDCIERDLSFIRSKYNFDFMFLFGDFNLHHSTISRPDYNNYTNLDALNYDALLRIMVKFHLSIVKFYLSIVKFITTKNNNGKVPTFVSHISMEEAIKRGSPSPYLSSTIRLKQFTNEELVHIYKDCVVKAQHDKSNRLVDNIEEITYFTRTDTINLRNNRMHLLVRRIRWMPHQTSMDIEWTQ
eukprot:673820_1